MVEIAKALGKDPRLLILDEATSALTNTDVKKVYDLLAELKAQGVGMLYISHRMHEIKELSDVMSVFRNGRHIETFAKGQRSDDQIVELMIGRRIKRVPVLRGTKLVGIVTRANLLRLLGDLLDVRAESGDDDKAIRERIFAELGEQLWARVEGMRVDVQDGAVTLGGVITDECVRDALRVAVENVPGVKGVKDDMVLLEPFTGTVLDPVFERQL